MQRESAARHRQSRDSSFLRPSVNGLASDLCDRVFILLKLCWGIIDWHVQGLLAERQC